MSEPEIEVLRARLTAAEAENVELRKGCDELVDALADIDELEARLATAESGADAWRKAAEAELRERGAAEELIQELHDRHHGGCPFCKLATRDPS